MPCGALAGYHGRDMCGFAALFAYADTAPAIDGRALMAMRESMAARGPDGAGTWEAPSGRAGLAHRRLAIIDLSESGAQPMVLADGDGGAGTLALSYNGEIYNYRDLRAELESAGAVFRGGSDTEVLLRLYRRDGAAMVERLRGMYAFALYDESRRGMLLARDPFGIKPLYYADDGATVAAASQVKALLAGGIGAAGGPDPAGHAGFHLFGSVPEPHTLYKDIHALPAGCTLWMDADRTKRMATHFDVAAELAGAEPPRPGADLGALLKDSVAHHLIADVDVGVFLSAGLDSASLCGLAAAAHGAGVHTLTLGFEEFAGTANDEVPLAERIAAAYATRHDTVWVRRDAFAAERGRLLAAMDQPSIDGVNVYFVAKAAAERGLKVALSGLGGDELFAGYDTFRQVPELVRTFGWVPGGRAIGSALRAVCAPVLGRFTSPKYAGLLEYGTRPGDAYLLRRGLFMPWELPGVMDPDMARAGWRALAPRLRLNDSVAGIDGPVRQVHALEMQFYMRNQLLRDADWAGMAHGVEIRVPLVDVALFRALSPALGRAHAPTKRDMAAALSPALPDAVLNRPKTGFFIPVHDWLGDGGAGARGLRGWARDVYQSFSD